MSLGRLGQDVAEVWLNVFASNGGGGDISDVISRHPQYEDPGDLGAEERPPGWQGTIEERQPGPGEALERPPPGEPSPYWYQVGPGGLFYWQWAAIAGGAVLLYVASDGRRRRR
jgi:hypothetical protein